MLAEIKILVQGYSNVDSIAESGEEKTRPTISLVRDGDLVIVVDPGVMEDQRILIDALRRENLTISDVNMVCITHSHLDHYRNIGMFPNAKTLEYFGIWDKEGAEDFRENLTENVKVLHTPGHDYTGITLFVKTRDGVVAICGDVFWKKGYPKDPYDDTFASNPKKLSESREMVMKMADWIIPGHGDIFKNDKLAAIADIGYGEPQIDHPKVVIKCEKCGREMLQQDKCRCRPWLCYKCCECDMDCDTCSCSRRR